MNVIGNWSEQDLQALNEGISSVCQRLGDAPFNWFFPSMQFKLNPRLKHYAIADKYGITFRPGRITTELIWHELGHVLASRLWPRGPVAFLRNNGIYIIGDGARGRFLTGRQPPYAYNRNNNVRAPENGYQSDDWKDGFQLHPRRMSGVESGNNASEDWADIFGNWGRGTFVNNAAGNALYSWADMNLRSCWLQV